ncbi:M23 family metallopeptidase [Streptomyces sp. TRM66268-LWL]|uniref:M23 family metallopeptidase n=1 Tax=Streptomyces polyasparticus TaxID=2767826 RepID=A0ABR7STU4_9ACTN|nr:M23 family metallopeptidase [Streptomyces polyasparticus]MBC9717956.1 M23 family metallopeptidase [Streptomyces polyasparticus]
MSKSAKSHITRPLLSTRARATAAVVTAGLAATSLLGAGVAMAADEAAGNAGQVSTQVTAASAQQAAAKKAAGWEDPVQHYTLSASFGMGGGMWAHKHSGQDFAVPIGTPVDAVHAGTVVKAGPNGAGDGPAYGNAIVIKHDNGKYSQYAHLSKIQVRIGQHVNTGQQIALSGNTGNSSGPHLHFEIRTTPNYGSAINPVNYLRSLGVKV